MPPSESLQRYRALLKTNEYSKWDRFAALTEFIETNDQGPKALLSVLTLNPDGSQEPETECTGYSEFASFLNSSPIGNGACRLFLVENLCAETIALLHEHFDVEADVFAKHVNNESWFRGQDMADFIPDLPSALERRGFIEILHMEALSVYQRSCPDKPPPGEVLDLSQDYSVGYGKTGNRKNPTTRFNKHENNFTRAWRQQDRNKTRISRGAEKIKPLPRPDPTGGGELLHYPYFCAKNHSVIWYRTNNDGSWIGILLLDPVFEANMVGSNGEQYDLCRFESVACDLPSRSDNCQPCVTSSRKIIANSWRKMNEDHIKLALSDCFTTLHSLYGLVAHSWVVLNEQMNQELATIEYTLETGEPAFNDLERYLKAIYCHRRRCVKSSEFISHTRDQCSTSGQRSWHPSSGVQQSEMTKALEKDFKYLLSAYEQTQTRIDKTINLLTALVAIGAGKQGLDESKGITRLTLFATIFIPFSTVATVLGMEDPFGPAAEKFWIFWAVALPFTFVVVVLVFVVVIERYLSGLWKPPRTRIEREKIGWSKV